MSDGGKVLRYNRKVKQENINPYIETDNGNNPAGATGESFNPAYEAYIKYTEKLTQLPIPVEIPQKVER